MLFLLIIKRVQSIGGVGGVVWQHFRNKKSLPIFPQHWLLEFTQMGSVGVKRPITKSQWMCFSHLKKKLTHLLTHDKNIFRVINEIKKCLSDASICKPFKPFLIRLLLQGTAECWWLFSLDSQSTYMEKDKINSKHLNMLKHYVKRYNVCFKKKNENRVPVTCISPTGENL